MLSRPNASPLTRSCVFPSPKPVRTMPSLRRGRRRRDREEPDVGRGRDQHAAKARQHAVGKRQPVGEDGRMLVAAVAVAILEPPDPARRPVRPGSRSSRRHRADHLRPRRSRPGSSPLARRRPARWSAPGRPARMPPARRAASAGRARSGGPSAATGQAGDQRRDQAECESTSCDP